MLVALTPMSAGGHDVAACLRSNLLPNGCGPGRLEARFEAKVTPRQLPSREFVPIGVAASGVVETQNGGHPSALREATVTLDRGIRVNTKDLAACSRRRLERMTIAAARKVCRRAIGGRGVARVGLASSGTVLRMPLTLFNGGTSAGVTRLFVHGAAGATGDGLVAVGQIRQRGNELQMTWRLPRILEGDGSLLGFKLEVKRSFAASGRRHSYLSARCPKGLFRVNVPKLGFVNEARIPGVPSRTFLKGGLAVPCRPKHFG